MDLGHWQTKLLIDETQLPYGFIYIITNTVTNKKYIGKKQIKSVKKLQPLKGKKNKRHFDIETDWKTYTSSSSDLNADIAKYGKEKFVFEILSKLGVFLVGYGVNGLDLPLVSCIVL